LKIAGISSKKLGDSYEGQLKNNYLYQGAYAELDEDIGWQDFYLRNYDAQIGRFVQQDPYEEFPSPYTGMGNDPVNNIDPSGGETLPFNAIKLGGTMSQTAATAITLGEVVIRSVSTVARTASGLSTVMKVANITAKVFQVANLINTSINTAGVGNSGNGSTPSSNSPTPNSQPNEDNEGQQSFPSFQTLYTNYPKPYRHKPDRTPANPNVPVDDNDNKTFLYPDQCAIRMSVGLIKSGVDLTGVKNVTSPGKKTYSKDGYVLGAKNLTLHLQKTILKKDPQVFDGTKVDVRALLKGKKGIIYFERFKQSDGTIGEAHIDLWDGYDLQNPTPQLIFFRAKNIRFFEIK